MKTRVLWIEDGAFSELMSLGAPIYSSGLYDLTIALTAGEGYQHLLGKEFDAVIVDIRLPPGSDPFFIKAFKQLNSKVAARLGLRLLQRVLAPTGEHTVPDWINPKRFGVFTVETLVEIEHELEELGIKVYRQKTETLPKTVILNIIEEILSQSNPKET